MFPNTADTWRLLLVGYLGGLCLTGCTGDGAERFTPSPDAARAALEKALTDWQAGLPPGAIAGKPAIQVADTHRRSGQVLVTYDVLGELPLDNGRRFQVRLTFDRPPVEEKAQYVVIGIDPLWVLRQEDYDMITHWEHPMPPASGTASLSPAPAAGVK